MGGEELVGQNLGGTLGFSSLPVLVMCPGVFGCFGVLALALPSGRVDCFRNRVEFWRFSGIGCDVFRNRFPRLVATEATPTRASSWGILGDLGFTSRYKRRNSPEFRQLGRGPGWCEDLECRVGSAREVHEPGM